MSLESAEGVDEASRDEDGPRSVYRSPRQDLAQNLDENDLASALTTREGLLWVLLTPEHEDSRRLLQDIFGFHRLAIDDCTNERVDTPKVDDYTDYLFIVAQSVDASDGWAQLHLEELDVFLGPNYVVTIKSTGALPSIDRLFEDACSGGQVLEHGADFLAHSVLDVIVDELLPAVEAIDERLDNLQRGVIERPSKVLLTEILQLKRDTLRLRRSIIPQRDMVNRLSRGEFASLIRREAQIFFRDIYDHIVRVEAMLDAVRDVTDSALSTYLSAQNNRLNEIMKAMSVVAVIFLPLTLIASIFGTNLEYSALGLTLDGGFYWMLVLMFLIAGGMVLYFKRRNWF